ncbi:MAG: LysR family transcriptional regulator [Deltaproteobacteria bacterium]|nr:LysR family transcriptional regulator [Deltaproteobacteria bacterium]
MPLPKEKLEHLSVKSKVWIEIEGLPFLGEGRRNLLQLISKTGSISQAARELGISYKKAWSYIKNMEDRLGTTLVTKFVGGKGGGGTTLTQEGRILIEKYDQLLDGNQEAVNKTFHEIF